MSISLIVLTYNEELNLGKCLKSVHGLTSEIIIVDSGSTDGTKKIAEEFGAKFVTHEFKNQAEQFNWALEQTNPTGDWILRLDADEELLPELKEEIEKKLPIADQNTGGFYLNRRNYFLGKWTRHGGYYPAWFLRIFRKGWAKSESREMDEHLILLRGDSERLKNDFVDNNLKGLADWKNKHRKYAEREAIAYYAEKNDKQAVGPDSEQAGRKRWVKKNIYYRLPPFLRVGLYFIYRYVFLLGFLDGWRGTKFHFLQGVWYRGLIDRNICKKRKITKSSKFWILFALLAAAVLVVIIGHYFFVSSYADADWYIKIAKGAISEVIKPFSGRVLHPMVVHLVSSLSGLSIDTSFWIFSIFLLFGFMAMLYRFFSEISFINPVLAFVIVFSPLLLDYFRYFYLAELFYSFLLLVFFYLLKKQNFFLSLLLLFLLFITRPIQAMILGFVLVVVSFYKSDKKFSAIALVVVLLATLISFQISDMGQPNAHNLDNFRYYVLQPIYYFVRSVLGVDWVANTQLQYCVPKFSVSVPGWVPLGDIKSIGICDFNIKWPLQTLFYPLIAFGFLPLALFSAARKKWREIWNESPIWLLTALIYGIGILFIAILVPNGLRPIGYGWPAFWLAGLFIFDKYTKEWPAETRKSTIKFFAVFQIALLWLPYLVTQGFSFANETIKYSTGVIIALLLYFIFIKTYRIIAKGHKITYNLLAEKTS